MPSRMVTGTGLNVSEVTVLRGGFHDTKAPSSSCQSGLHLSSVGSTTMVLTFQMKWKPQGECWQPPQMNLTLRQGPRETHL